MTRAVAALLPLLLQLLLLQDASCELKLEVDNKTVELEESGESLGEEYRLPRRLELSLKCKLTSDSPLNPSITWTPPGGASVEESRFSVSETLSDNRRSFVSTLTIKSPLNSDLGQYRCVGNASGSTSSSVGFLNSRPLLTLLVDGKASYDRPVWPGSSVTIVCQVDGSPRGSVAWYRNDENDESKVASSKNGSLVIDSVTYERDRGYITCKSSNKLGDNSARLYLRVKNPTGFLLPMIVVIVEIVLIVIIVVLYELAMRKRRQQQGDEDKAD